MRSKRRKSEIKIPRLAIPIIIAIFIILSVSAFRAILNYPPEKRPLETNQKITLAENKSPQTRLSLRSIYQKTPFSDYQAIIENNIFRPLGWEKAKPAPILPVLQRREIPRERPAPTYTLTLTGIAKKGKEQVVLIEDSKAKDGYFLRSGEQLKDYTVSAIESEQIVLAKAGSEIKLALGEKIRYNTSGQIILSPYEAASSSPAISSSPRLVSDTQSQTNNDDEHLSLIERMKLRRRKELNKQ